MKTPALVVAFTAAGAIGGVVGALVAGGGTATPTTTVVSGPAATPAADVATAEDVDAVVRRLETLEANLSTANADVASLREAVEERDTVIADLEQRLAAEPGGHGLAGPGTDAVDAKRALAKAMEDGALKSLENRVMALGGESFRKAAELRKLPEEERWEKARDELGLSAYQEEELKNAIAERTRMVDEATKASEQTVETADGRKMTFRMPDPEKMREAQRTYDDHVERTLTAEQRKSWRDKGYERALGGGGGGVTSIAIGVGR